MSELPDLLHREPPVYACSSEFSFFADLVAAGTTTWRPDPASGATRVSCSCGRRRTHRPGGGGAAPMAGRPVRGRRSRPPAAGRHRGQRRHRQRQRGPVGRQTAGAVIDIQAGENTPPPTATWSPTCSPSFPPPWPARWTCPASCSTAAARRGRPGLHRQRGRYGAGRADAGRRATAAPRSPPSHPRRRRTRSSTPSSRPAGRAQEPVHRPTVIAAPMTTGPFWPPQRRGGPAADHHRRWTVSAGAVGWGWRPPTGMLTARRWAYPSCLVGDAGRRMFVFVASDVLLLEARSSISASSRPSGRRPSGWRWGYAGVVADRTTASRGPDRVAGG